MSAATMPAPPAWSRRSPSSPPRWKCCASRPGTACPMTASRPTRRLVAERVATLTRLLEPGTRPRIVLTTVNALVQKVPPRDGLPRRHPAAAAGRAGDSRRRSPPSSRPMATAAPAPSWSRANTPPAAASSTSTPPASRTRCALDLFGDEIESLAPLRHRHPAQRAAAASELVAPPGRRGPPRPSLHHPLPRRLARAVRPRRGRRPAL